MPPSWLGPEPIGALATVVETAASGGVWMVVVRTSDEHELTYYAGARSSKGQHVARNPLANIVLY